MAKFLVTDLKVIDSPQAGIGVARSLKAAGHTVYGADDTPFITSSDLFEKTVVLEEIRNLNLDSLVKKLSTLKKAYDIEYIVPCYDETTILFSFIREKLDFLKFNLIAPNIEILRKIRKTNLENITYNQFANPKTRIITSIKEGEEFADEVSYPVFVKGLTKGAIRATNKQELDAAIKRICNIWNNKEIHCIVQKEIVGEFINGLVAYKQGEVVAYLEMEKIGMDGNGATWFGKLKLSTDMLKKVESFCKNIDLNDCVIEFETIRTTDGEFYLYEINPRPPAWIYACCLNGMNFLDLFIKPSSQTEFNKNEVYFGKESSDFIKLSQDMIHYSNLTAFSKGSAYKSDSQKYPSELIL